MEPRRVTVTFELATASTLSFDGIAMEGHPECEGDLECAGSPQDNESLELWLNGQFVGVYHDGGLDLSGWFSFGPWSAEGVAGTNTLVIKHTGELGQTHSPGSIAWKMSVSAQPLALTLIGAATSAADIAPPPAGPTGDGSSRIYVQPSELNMGASSESEGSYRRVSSHITDVSRSILILSINPHVVVDTRETRPPLRR